MKIFVFITGLLGIPVGIAALSITLLEPHDQHFGGLFMAALLLFFTSVVLMWAAQDLPSRSPVVFWDGFVRIAYGASILYTVPAGLADPWEYGVVIFDGSIATVYIVGTMRHTQSSFFTLLQGRVSN